MNRFISIISAPGRVWSDHEVIDTQRGIRMCICADERSAGEIAACLNLQYQRRQQQQDEIAKLFITDKT